MENHDNSSWVHTAHPTNNNDNKNNPNAFSNHMCMNYNNAAQNFTECSIALIDNGREYLRSRFCTATCESIYSDRICDPNCTTVKYCCPPRTTCGEEGYCLISQEMAFQEILSFGVFIVLVTAIFALRSAHPNVAAVVFILFFCVYDCDVYKLSEREKADHLKLFVCVCVCLCVIIFG
eukprot:PhF_6_TR4308/c0_g1_i1/m.5813